MVKRICALVLVLLLAVSVMAFAAEQASAKDQNAGTKLLRGATNLGFCWLEPVKQAYLVSKEQNAYIGLTYGIIKGLGVGAFRLIDGVFEAVTCVIPPYDKILVEPELIFEGW
jgi:putative exosortase-associated protein (TIGR04073 family)